PQRALPVEWGSTRGAHEAGVAVEGVDRKYLLKDVTNLIAQEDAHVHAISSERIRGSAHVRLRLQVRVQDFGQLARLLGKMEAIAGVERAYRS
ncbi:MAG: ACT domain-containing protein, partial [Luteimonas sp.]